MGRFSKPWLACLEPLTAKFFGFRNTLVVAAGVLMALAWPFPAFADDQRKFTLRYRLFDAPDAQVWHPVFHAWSRRLTAISNGRLQFVPARDATPIRPLNQAQAESTRVPSGPLLDALRGDDVDLVWMRPADIKGRFPRLGAFELPFMVQEPIGASRALWEYALTYAPDELNDLRVLAAHVQGRAQMHLRGVSKNDLDAGLDPLCRQPMLTGSAPIRALFEALECDPKHGNQNAASLDASAGANGQHRAARLMVLPYAVLQSVGASAGPLKPKPGVHIETVHTEPGLGVRTYMLAMSPRGFEMLPDDLRALIDESSGADTSAWFGKRMQYRDDLMRVRLSIRPITELGKTPQARLRAAAKRVSDQWRARIDALGHDAQQLLDGARTLLKQHTQ